MRDRSKQLLVINTGKKESEQTRLPAQSGTTHIIGGGGLSVNMSDYLLKSIWDKVWEIRTDSQGTEYIFGKLPMVTQYGITMYSGDGVDIPSLASGLPFDGRTIWYNPETQQIEVIGGTGGGSGEGVSNFWDLSGIPSWITNSKPKYTYSEIEGTPDLTKYALASQIPSLSGYATESWVAKQNYATKATTLSGYGITDAYTKTNVDDLLKSYVTLGGTQTITGEKNFTGGLKVNGSPIVYDSTKKYWKLEGDLLVTGGVTMYGNEGTYTPSTIMDAISVDGTTISKSGGVLKVIGGVGASTMGSLSNVGNWADSVADADRIMYQAAGSSSWTSKPLSSIAASGDYLPLSGGTLTGNLIVNSNIGVGGSIVNKAHYLFARDNNNADWIVTDKNWSNEYKLWHSGNDGSGSGLDADLLDGKHNGELTAFNLVRCSGGVLDANTLANSDFLIKYYAAIASSSSNIPTYTGYQNAILEIPLHSNGITAQFYFSYEHNPYFRAGVHKPWNELAYKTDNVASATKLQTARTIWGQSFDGTNNITGTFKLGNYELQTAPYGITLYGAYSTLCIQSSNNYNTGIDFLGNDGISRWTLSYRGQNNSNNDFYICRQTSPTESDVVMSFIKSDGYVGIGKTHPNYKLDVNGSISASSDLYVNGGKIKYDSTNKYWKLEGDLLVTGGVTMYGNEGTYTPSTIMDAISVDGTTIAKEGGVLKVIGGTGGGVADSVAWANITGKPNFASVATSGKYDDLIGKPTLLSSFTDDIVSGKYLPLSGGTINGYISVTEYIVNKRHYLFARDNANADWIVTNKDWNAEYALLHSGNYSQYALPLSGGTINFSSGNPYIGYANSGIILGGIGVTTNFEPFFYNSYTGTNSTIWHSGNDGSGSGLDADLLDGKHNGELTASMLLSGAGSVLDANEINFSDYSLRFFSIIPNTSTNFPTSSGYQNGLLALPLHSNSATAQLYFAVGKNPYFRSHQTLEWNELAYKTDNVASATKLQTARTIWGKSFDGTGNIDGNMLLKGQYVGIALQGTNVYNTGIDFKDYEGDVRWSLSYRGLNAADKDFFIYRYTDDNSYHVAMSLIRSNGNVGIGTTSPSSKLHLYSKENTTLRIQSDGSGGDQGAICMKKASGNGLVFAVENRDFIWQTGSASLTGGGTERMRLTSGGNVGIGTTSPTSLLHVNGDGRITDIHFRGSYINLNRDGVTGATFDSTKTALEIESRLAVSILRTYNVTRQASIVLHTNGNIGIGTLTPSAQLHVSGDILATGGITMYSMRALKNVVDERGLSLNELSTIKPTRYTWKDGRDNRLHIGGIADDIQQVLPEVVYSTSDGILTMDYGNAAFAVASSLIKPVVDHEKRIAMLEEENKQLRLKVEQLKRA